MANAVRRQAETLVSLGISGFMNLLIHNRQIPLEFDISKSLRFYRLLESPSAGTLSF